MSKEPQAVSPLTRTVLDRLQRILGGSPGMTQLESALRLLAKWRSQVLANTLRAHSGSQVLAGPFRGMHYDLTPAEGALATRLLGCYEASLAPILETVIARGYPQVIDIGCAEGYYAVGLARRMPATQVLARDTDPKAQEKVLALARANGVADRVQVGGVMDHAGLDLCHAARTFVLCDIEGAEEDLLDPKAAPGLLAADILVEVHEQARPGLLARLTDRFAATHRITRLDRQLDPGMLPPWAEELNDLDRLLLLWEWRAGPTPWLWMERKDSVS